MQNSFFILLELIVREPLTIIFSISAMLLISAKLTLFVFIFLPIADEHTLLHIENEGVAKSFRMYFEIMWKALG